MVAALSAVRVREDDYRLSPSHLSTGSGLLILQDEVSTFGKYLDRDTGITS